MSEEAVEELETTETSADENATPSTDAETPSEETPEQETTTEVEKTEAEIEAEKQQNQQHALLRKTKKLAKQLREEKQRVAELAAQNKPSEPRAEDFDTQEAYTKALVDYGISQGKETPTYDPLKDIADEMIANGTQKYADFADKAFASPEMMPVLGEFDNADEIAYYLGENPQDANRIQQLSPIGMAKEFALIEAKINTPKPRTTKAPDPITPILDGATTPVDDSKLSPEEWIAKRNKERAGKPY